MIQGFLALRKHADRITLLVDMMAGSGMPCFKSRAAAVAGLRKRFHLSLPEPQVGVGRGGWGGCRPSSPSGAAAGLPERSGEAVGAKQWSLCGRMSWRGGRMRVAVRQPCMRACGGPQLIPTLPCRTASCLPAQVVEVLLGLIADSLDNWRTRQYDYYQRILNGIL